uniref:Uncharacterized protein n=1 Tax=Anguilla anguilla TaxID=7936 RepID=A0A0E9W904_ANGAN
MFNIFPDSTGRMHSVEGHFPHHINLLRIFQSTLSGETNDNEAKHQSSLNHCFLLSFSF